MDTDVQMYDDMCTAPNPAVQIHGPYAARLTNIRRFVTAFGARIAFELTLLDGHPGETVLESAADSPNPKGKLASVILSLTGRPATPEELSGSFDRLIGTHCHVLLSPAENRSGKAYRKVERIFP